jgi:hypothetical protein
MRRWNDFPAHVKIACRERATYAGLLYCEGCGGMVKSGRVDHKIGAGQGGRPVLTNAQFLGRCCYSAKDATDNAIAKRLTRIDAAQGIEKKPPRRPIQSRGFPPRPERESRCSPTSKTLPRRLR